MLVRNITGRSFSQGFQLASMGNRIDAQAQEVCEGN